MKQAMIFAAGLGTRLKPLTDRMPKALVEVVGEPLLKRVVFLMKDAGMADNYFMPAKRQFLEVYQRAYECKE